MHTHVYAGGYLTSIRDGAGNTIVSFAYDGAAAGKVVRSDTARGMVGWEYGSSRPSCAGQTVLYFHRGNTASRSIDADCGSGLLCGGKTGAGSTGALLPRRTLPSVAKPEPRRRHEHHGARAARRDVRGRLPRRRGIRLELEPGVLELGAVAGSVGNYTARVRRERPARGDQRTAMRISTRRTATPRARSSSITATPGSRGASARSGARASSPRPRRRALARTQPRARARSSRTTPTEPTQIQQIGYDVDLGRRGPQRTIHDHEELRYPGPAHADRRPAGGQRRRDGARVLDLERFRSRTGSSSTTSARRTRRSDRHAVASLTFDAWGNAMRSMIDADGRSVPACRRGARQPLPAP